MAEALATISLVGNIVQFLTVGIKVASSIHEIYKNGSSESHTEVASTTGQLKGALDLLQNGPMVERDAELSGLAVHCSRLADDLMAILNHLKPDRRKNQLVEVTSKSLKSVRVRGKIRNIERKLDKMKDAVFFRLTVILSTDQAFLVSSLRDINDRTRMFYNETCERLDNMTLDLQNSLASRNSDHVPAVKFFEIARKLEKLVNEVKNSNKTCQILQSLYFKQMKERQSDIAEAHRDTFEWIFKEETDANFLKWLLSSDGIYWISGKAGSGKSTLMKFILRHPRTKEFLAKWARPRGLVIASHFFWSAGTAMQKSQEGLFKTLLFQIFAQCPEIIPQACPVRWKDTSFVWMESWTRAELFQAFKTISAISSLPQRVCLFIDGLDEYRGDHSELVDMLRVISQSGDIKICASSRPWHDFQDAFDASNFKLYVHDLTKEDIRLYVQDNLGRDSRFQALKQRKPQEAAFLVQRIQRKAQGVFLWVYLVVRSLLRGLLNRDEISDLRRRLDDLPGELEKYFKLMLDRIEPIYQEQSARVFKIMSCAGATLPIVMFHFVDKERNDSSYVLSQEIRSLSPAEITDAVDEKKRQLNARCRDLLHFTVDNGQTRISQQRVGFLHRTVADFLQTGEVDSLLSSRCNPEFDPYTSLCKAFLAILKASSIEHPRDEEYLLSTALGSIFYAKEASEQSEKTNSKILDGLNQVFTVILEHRNAKPQDSIPRSDDGSFLALAVRLGFSRYVEEKLSYTQDNSMKPSPRGNPKLGHLLVQALQKKIVIEKESDFWIRPEDEIDLSMVQLLLNSGADPNLKLEAVNNSELQLYDHILKAVQNHSDLAEAARKDEQKRSLQSKRTIWGQFLLQLETNFSHSLGGQREWDMMRHLNESTAPKKMPRNLFETCQLMIRHGAQRKYHRIDEAETLDSPNSLQGWKSHPSHHDDHYLDAVAVFVDIFSDSEAESLVRLLRQYEGEEQTPKGHCMVM